MSERLTIISRWGRVFEIVNYWQVLLVNPPLLFVTESETFSGNAR
ncbi:hypothetical protein QUB77_26835 [Microcoleus sp. AT9b-C3]